MFHLLYHFLWHGVINIMYSSLVEQASIFLEMYLSLQNQT
jgi:hypothetical protein